MQSLVDDDLVRMEKIGASNYYWQVAAAAGLVVAARAVLGAVQLDPLTHPHPPSVTRLKAPAVPARLPPHATGVAREKSNGILLCCCGVITLEWTWTTEPASHPTRPCNG